MGEAESRCGGGKAHQSGLYRPCAFARQGQVRDILGYPCHKGKKESWACPRKSLGEGYQDAPQTEDLAGRSPADSRKFKNLRVYAGPRITENQRRKSKIWRRGGRSFGDCGMMSLPFLLFACGLAAGWTQRRGAAMGFWAAGVVVMLVLFKMQATDALNISL
jgi:Family of unknown function (DUF5993)